MQIEFRSKVIGTAQEVRELAKERNGIYRAPHHTVSAAGLVGELAISAGGILYLEEADQLLRSALHGMLNTMAFMHPDARPLVVMACEGGPPSCLLEQVERGRELAAKVWEGQ
jgi:hypothetical protein